MLYLVRKMEMVWITLSVTTVASYSLESRVEKELLAIKLATNTFRVYLLGRQFQIVTDHRSLEWLDELKETNPRLTRWSLALQPFEFTVMHWPGKDNGNADVLSRIATN